MTKVGLPQQAVFVGKHHRAHLEDTACPPLQMGLNGGHQAGHHRPAESGLLQKSDSGVHCGNLHQSAAQYLIRPLDCGMGHQDLHPAVRQPGVGVHHPPSHFDELSRMAHHHHGGKALSPGHIQRLPQEVGALDTWDAGQLQPAPAQKIQSVISGG